MADDGRGAPPTCSGTSLDLGEPLAGTAPTSAGFLLLEHRGPWGARCLEDDTLPPGLGERLRVLCAAADLTPLLARRPGVARGAASEPTVVVAVPDGLGLALVRRVQALDDVLSLDVVAVAAAARAGTVSPGWAVAPYLVAVCTHGRRDACCSSLGRPVAARLAELEPEKVWETAHLGGHRFAASILALPSGVLYGRVPARWAEHVLSAVSSGRVLVELARGRSRLPASMQVAEIVLRGHLDEDRDAGVQPVESSATPLADPSGVRSTSTWSAAGTTWRVVVDTTPGAGPARPASCGAADGPAPPAHTVVEVTDTGQAGRGAQGWDESHRAGVGEPHPVVVEEVGRLRAGSAIDLACGTGRHALWLAERGWEVTGVDFSRHGLRLAVAEAAARGVVVDWQLGDARVWTPPHDGYDLVLMTFVHLPNVLPRVVRWLRPGGRLVVVGHAVRNGTGGVGGPSDPRLLYDVVDLAARVTGARLRVLRATEVERSVDGGMAVDAVLVAVRPGGPPAPVASTSG